MRAEIRTDWLTAQASWVVEGSGPRGVRCSHYEIPAHPTGNELKQSRASRVPGVGRVKARKEKQSNTHTT